MRKNRDLYTQLEAIVSFILDTPQDSTIQDVVLLIVAMNKSTNIWTLTSANFQFSNELHEATTSITKQQQAKN
jgi:hypothetical protein